MSYYVADASVIIKWMVPEHETEENVSQALELLLAIKRGAVQLLQPVHWLAEIAAVLARISQPTAAAKIAALQLLDIRTADTPEIWDLSVELAIGLNHHLFDTLYHAVALDTEGAELITADRHYFEKARGRGRILLLRDLMF